MGVAVMTSNFLHYFVEVWIAARRAPWTLRLAIVMSIALIVLEAVSGSK